MGESHLHPLGTIFEYFNLLYCQDSVYFPARFERSDKADNALQKTAEWDLPSSLDIQSASTSFVSRSSDLFFYLKDAIAITYSLKSPNSTFH